MRWSRRCASSRPHGSVPRVRRGTLGSRARGRGDRCFWEGRCSRRCCSRPSRRTRRTISDIAPARRSHGRCGHHCSGISRWTGRTWEFEGRLEAMRLCGEACLGRARERERRRMWAIYCSNCILLWVCVWKTGNKVVRISSCSILQISSIVWLTSYILALRLRDHLSKQSKLEAVSRKVSTLVLISAILFWNSETVL